MDPVNLLNEANHGEQDRILRESFDLFGDRIIVAHAKDYVIDGGVLRSVPSGKGFFDTKLFCSLLAQRKSGIDVILEDTHPDTIADSIAHVRSCF